MEGGENKQELAMEKEEERKEEDISLKDLSRRLEEFAKERDWEQHHSPRNLLLAMVRHKTFFFFVIIQIFLIVGLYTLRVN